MAEGQLELEFTTTGAATVLETIELVKRNASAAGDVSRNTALAAQKQKELSNETRKAAQAAKEKAQAEAQAAISAAKGAAANRSAAAISGSGGGFAGGMNRGQIEVKGANELRASSEVFSASVQAVGVVMATASVAMKDSASEFLAAASKISGMAGMGWGIGQMFGGNGGIVGAVGALAYGLTTEISKGFFEEWAGTDEATQKRNERLRKRRDALRQVEYEDAKAANSLEKVKTADEAKSLVKSLEEQLADARLKFEYGLDGEGTMQERQAKLTTLEKRLAAAKEVEEQLSLEKRLKDEAAQRRQIDEATRRATNAAIENEWKRDFGEADTAKKIEMLSAKLEENSRVLEAENEAFRKGGMSDENFAWHKQRYETALMTKNDLEVQLASQRLTLTKEKVDEAKRKADETKATIESRASEIAAEYNVATVGYSASGTQLQRAGIAYGGQSTLAVKIAQATAENVKGIFETLKTGIKVSEQNKTPVVS